jgi:ubiquinone/menaquinone biosynthesis C-methylase UbiE
MIKEAVKQTKNPNVIYRNGYGHETGMPHNSVDIVTASSSIHWMEPIPTIEEIVRILKPGGIFSFYGYQCPPVSHSWGLDKAYFRFRKDLDDLEAANIGEGTLNRWGWNEIIDKINHSEKFRFVRTYYLHKKIDWTSEQYQGWIYAHGGLQYLVKKGIGVSINGLDAFKDLIVTSFRGTSKTIFFTYRVITCFI